MKKLVLTIAVVLGMAAAAYAYGPENRGGLFQRGAGFEEDAGYGYRGSLLPGLPNHNENDDQPAPLGTGLVVLTALGAAYLVGKKRKEE